MAMDRNSLLVLILLVLFLVLSPSAVLAFGVAPSSYNYDYVPGKTSDLNLRVLNFDNEDLLVYFDVVSSDDVDVSFDTDVVSLSPDEREKTVGYSLYLGDDPTPGIHKVEIRLVQFPNNEARLSNSVVDITTTVVQKISIFVPYDGPYLIGDLFAKSGNVGDPLTFITQVVNKGTEATELTGYVSILDPLDNEVAHIDIPSKSLAPLEKASLQSTYSGLRSSGYMLLNPIFSTVVKNWSSRILSW